MKPDKDWLSLWPSFFLLSFLEAVAGFGFLLRIPSEGSQGFLGFSLARWAILLPLGLSAGVLLIAAIIAYRRPTFVSTWLDPDTRPQQFQFLSFALSLLVALTSIGAYVLRWLVPQTLTPLFERAWPLLAFILVFSIQSALWLVILRTGLRKHTLDSFKAALIAFVLLIGVYLFVALTRLGLTPDKAYWGEPGVPIQGWQFLLVLLLSGLFFIFSLYPGLKWWPVRPEGFIILLVFCIALVIWLSVPNEVLRNSFYFPIDPPEHMPFPYSDSGYYDYMAHSLLIGTEYVGEIPTRPLYILLLTLLHLLFGNRYDLIILGQTVVLAAFPVIFYILGRAIHSRAAGFTIALLAIAREWSNLLVSSNTRVSNTKTLLVDMPSLLMILLACYFAFRWLERKDRFSAFVAGGIFGVMLLIRTQALLILPALFFLAVFSFRANKRGWLAPLFIFLLGLLLSVTPWLTHNYTQIGNFTFDAPFQLKVLASQYAYTGNLDYGSVNLEGKGLLGILLTFALKDPGFVAGFITNHFLATEIGALLALPLIMPFEGLLAPINLYWTAVDIQLNWYNQLLLIGYLAFIALGLGAAWRRWRWAGLLPLAFNLGYALANGIGRFSGWRYDLPADWIAYFYFGIGFAEILVWLAGVLGVQKERILPAAQLHSGSPERRSTHWAGLALLFILIGSSPWIAKSMAPQRYPEKTNETIRSEMVFAANLGEMGITEEALHTFARQPESITIQGRLLYPRFFWRDAGLTSSTPWQSYAPREYPRLGFLLINQHVSEVVLPIADASIANIQARDVLIMGCQRKSHIEARFVVFPNEKRAYLSTFGLDSCSP